MASTYTTRIRLEKQGSGDNDSTWGTVLNQNVIDLIDTAIAGYTTISLAGGDVSLTANDGTTDESRSAVLRLTGTLTGHTGVYLPLNVSKIYVVRNATSGAYNATVLISGGSGHVVPQGGSVIVYTDGVTVSPAFDSVGLGYGTAATLNFGTSVNELIPVSAADARYVTAATAQTITGAKTFSTTEVIASATQVYSKPVAIAVSTSSVMVDFSTGNNFTTILDANVTFDNPTSPQPGQSGIIYVSQDGTGSRTASFASDWKFIGGIAPTLSTAASSVDAIIYNVKTSTAISVFAQLDIK